MFDQFDGYLFDLDGVIYLEDEVIPGARETVAALKRRGKRVYFVSNTSRLSRVACVEKLRTLGFDVEPGEVLVTTRATARLIAERTPGASAYVLGLHGMWDELQAVGIDARPANVPNPEPLDYFIVAHVESVSYVELTCALRAIRAGAQFVAANRDPTYPGPDGPMPGLGAVVSAIETMVGRPPDIMIGKPSTTMLEMAIQHGGLKPERCVMIGDTMETDIAAGNQLGMATIWVKTGNTAPQTIPEALRPDWVLPSVSHLLEGAQQGS